MKIKKKLIFDLGFYNGDDSDFYLKKGFNVVAVEANPYLVKDGTRRFQKQIEEEKLILIDKVISANKGRQKFYIHPNKPDWSSCNKGLAESDGSRAKVIFVETVSLNDLCQNFGTPLYIKVDIEGCDLIIAEQLYSLKNKPQYVSFEISKRDYTGIFPWLHVSGYKKFQLVNQLNNINRENINYQFSKYSSGFFGKDLDDNRWLSHDETLGRYLKYKELKIIDNKELALGWLDLHASL